MNVLSAGLPGVKCKLYSLPVFSFGSKRKMAILEQSAWVEGEEDSI